VPETPVLNEIRRWYRYANWANTLMFDACATLDSAALTRDVGSSFGSVIGTLEHIYAADWLWLERWLGRSHGAFPATGSCTTIEGFRAAYAALDLERMRFLATLDDAALRAPLRYTNMKGDPHAYPLGELLFHVSNHATYHRGQIMHMVRQLGGTVKSSDYLYWLPNAS
jgi:uncharacterized damage-inducible protein DinB